MANAVIKRVVDHRLDVQAAIMARAIAKVNVTLIRRASVTAAEIIEEYCEAIGRTPQAYLMKQDFDEKVGELVKRYQDPEAKHPEYLKVVFGE